MTSKSISSLSTFDSLYKDLYPRSGDRIKQWVVDSRNEREWVMATCPRIPVAAHNDNTGLDCRNVGSAIWMDLAHDCCEHCCDLHDALAARPDVVAWLTEHAARPPGCTDRSVLSDEIAPDMGKMGHPLFEAMKRSR